MRQGTERQVLGQPGGATLRILTWNAPIAYGNRLELIAQGVIHPGDYDIVIVTGGHNLADSIVGPLGGAIYAYSGGMEKRF